ncbi:MAG: ATP-binding cassette domain-containing protein [Bdellovibrionales bacterium]|nr:ATP-binding cassette domain-containing protein [Bdellovibrionales bacterium]
MYVRLSGVSKWYHGQTRVLDHVDLEMNRGDFLYVVGGSGAGKSTLLRLIATDDVASQGQVQVFGYDLAKVNPSTLRTIRQSIGYVPQNHQLISDLSVYENIALSSRLSRNPLSGLNLKNSVHELLEKLNLVALRNRSISQISGGECQRTALARALIRKPEILIADEPTGSQDPETTWVLMDQFLRANTSGTTVLLATHDREIVRRVRKRCAQMKHGRVMLEDGLCFY